MVKWTEDLIEQCIDILNDHIYVCDALVSMNSSLRLGLGESISDSALRKAFRKYDRMPPSNYLVLSIAESTKRENMDEFIRLLKLNKYTTGYFCKKFKISQKVLEYVLFLFEEEGFEFDLSEGKIGFKSPEKHVDIIDNTSGEVFISDKWSSLFAVISDTHFGSKQSAIPQLKAFLEYAHRQGVCNILHCGDVFDGLYHRGHEYELVKPDFESHLQIALDALLPLDGVKYHLISGNHDHNGYRKKIGLDPCKILEDRARANGRKDITYYGPTEAHLLFGDQDYEIKVEIAHPEKSGATYAISYGPQKWVERGYEPGFKPHFSFIGHLHRLSEFEVRNVEVLQPGCFQWQTQFLKTKGIVPAVGGVIVEANRDKHCMKWRVQKVKFWQTEKVWKKQFNDSFSG